MTSTQSLPRVSVGIPTYNRSAYLLEAIQSVLSQTHTALEIIVSDNASTDDTPLQLERFSDPRIVSIRHAENIGMTANFNATLAAATGEYFLMLSDDDLLLPEAVERLLAPFLAESFPAAAAKAVRSTPPTRVGMVWCPCTIIDETGKTLWQTAAGPLQESSVSMIEELWRGHRGPRLASVIVRTEDARLVGGYDEDRFGLLCDTGNWAQVAIKHGSVACVAEPLVRYRVHAVSGTGAAVCAQWQRWGESLHSSLTGAIKQRWGGADAERLAALRKPLLANLTVDVLMRGKGSPGWKLRTLRECWRSRKYLLTAYCLQRLLRDGLKLLR